VKWRDVEIPSGSEKMRGRFYERASGGETDRQNGRYVVYYHGGGLRRGDLESEDCEFTIRKVFKSFTCRTLVWNSETPLCLDYEARLLFHKGRESI
jgi:acetyl esterase/lipase